jgi:alpha-glucosidase (family GH31 glycosyl hydrolase)
MSSAGYGVFFNNEFSTENRISFDTNIVIENTAKHGQLDLFFFRGTSYRRLIDLYTDVTGKPPMPPKKLLGFNYLVKGTGLLDPVLDEEQFPEWVKRGYPIDSCITFTDQRIATDREIAAVDATAQRVHKLHGALCCYFDLYTPGTFPDSRPWPTRYPYRDWVKFKETLKARLLDHGVDWFWFDETEDLPYVHELYQATIEACEAQDSRRGFLCGRGGQAGCQRFGYPWMGDTDYGKSSMLASLCNGLIGVAHSTHDMSGGVAGKTEDQYLSGVKANLLNPISQCNNWSPGWIPSHIPWEWSSRAEHVFRRYLDLHYQLIPYFYTMFWQAHTTGLPDWRPLVLDQPERADLYARDEIMIGDSLLMAPLYQNSQREVYLPPGRWHGYFDGITYAGDQILKNYRSTPDGYPLFVKAGAIIPMAPTMRYVDEKPLAPLILDIYPEERSSATLYEDDGMTRQYKNGNYCVTEITCVGERNTISVSLKERKGLYNPGPRDILFKVLTPVRPSDVLVDGQKLERIDSLAALTARKPGWGFFPDVNSGAFKTFIVVSNQVESTNVKLIIGSQVEQPQKPVASATFMALTDGSCDSRKVQ